MYVRVCVQEGPLTIRGDLCVSVATRTLTSEDTATQGALLELLAEMLSAQDGPPPVVPDETLYGLSDLLTSPCVDVRAKAAAAFQSLAQVCVCVCVCVRVCAIECVCVRACVCA